MIWIYFFGSYLIGSLMAGYFVVKALGKKDIRTEGSGNVGARNAGRIHGKTSFVLTFIGDAFKGAIVVLAGRYLEFSSEIILIGLGICILGHLKPVTLGFKGGMGISTFIGGMMAFEPALTLVLIIGFLLFYPFLKSFTFAGLGSFLMIPFAINFMGSSWRSTIIAMTLVLIILFVHREDINERLTKSG